MTTLPQSKPYWKLNRATDKWEKVFPTVEPATGPPKKMRMYNMQKNKTEAMIKKVFEANPEGISNLRIMKEIKGINPSTIRAYISRLLRKGLIINTGAKETLGKKRNYNIYKIAHG
jgi:hypothetical protein